MSNSDLVFKDKNKTLFTTAKAIADALNYEHRAVLQLIESHMLDLSVFGCATFQMYDIEQPNGGNRKQQTYVLNEPQATLLICYMKNTEKVRKFKVALVKAFYEMRKQLDEERDQQVMKIFVDSETTPDALLEDIAKSLKDYMLVPNGSIVLNDYEAQSLKRLIKIYEVTSPKLKNLLQVIRDF